VLLGAGILLGFVAWRRSQPAVVTLITPTPRTVTETIAASGEVGGRREAAVGAQAQGVVQRVLVDEGDVVARGQSLARLRSEVAEAQVRQAEQAVRTARAQLTQAGAGALPSELRSAQAQVRQAEATIAQRQAQVRQARAQVTQAEARLRLARETLRRNQMLYDQGAVARQSVDQARADYEVAVAEVSSVRENLGLAGANVEAARATESAARADLATLTAGPREEAVAVARQRVADAETALRVAREQAGNSTVVAPFAGTVTEIVSEAGTPVGPGGAVVRLVETGVPEIVSDVDEGNLDRLRVGQRAVITTSTFPDTRLEGRVTRLGARVDPERGTVEVRVTPGRDATWLRPGLTVNVNVVTAEGATRLTVPGSSLKRVGDRRSVFTVSDGRAAAREVRVGPVEGETVPVLSGLAAGDKIIRDAAPIEAGQRVSVRGGGDR
jgi:HlyD family secretion protein